MIDYKIFVVLGEDSHNQSEVLGVCTQSNLAEALADKLMGDYVYGCRIIPLRLIQTEEDLTND